MEVKLGRYIFFFIIANVGDVEGEGSVQGNGPPPLHNQLNFQTLREYLHLVRKSTPSCIILSLNQQAFNLKTSMIQIFPTFHGIDYENPCIHIKNFEEVCNIFFFIKHALRKLFGLNCSYSF